MTELAQFQETVNSNIKIMQLSGTFFVRRVLSVRERLVNFLVSDRGEKFANP